MNPLQKIFNKLASLTRPTTLVVNVYVQIPDELVPPSVAREMLAQFSTRLDVRPRTGKSTAPTGNHPAWAARIHSEEAEPGEWKSITTEKATENANENPKPAKQL